VITIYTKNEPPCSYCEQAKNLLRQKQVEHKVLTVGEDVTKEEMLNIVPNARTFPVVLDNGNFVGGLK
jgi:glutaredoxin 3